MSTWSQEEKCLLWLDSFPLEPAVKRRLLQTAGGATKLVKGFSAFEKEFSDGETFLRMRETLADSCYFEAIQARLEKESITPVFWGGAGYPKGWSSFAEAPICLYAKGNLRLLERRMFAVVGSRRTTEAARRIGKEIAEGLSAHFAVVSGSADGGDEAALAGALPGGGAVCLLAGGFGAQPKENPLLPQLQKQGLVLAACPFDTPVRVYSYEYRNKLLAAMSEGVLVLGAASKSGALITAGYAKRQGKPLFALPYSPSVAAGEGCNALIKAGAYLTENAQDILQHYGLASTAKKQVELTETERAVAARLQDCGEVHISELSKLLGIPAFKLTSVLASLEVKGVAVKLGGNRYSAI